LNHEHRQDRPIAHAGFAGHRGGGRVNCDLVIRGGRLITPHDALVADLGITGERIAAIGHGLHGQREIDARGLYVIPGAVDGHVHLTDPDYAPLYTPNADSFAVGSRAGACGGVTSFVDFCAPRAGLDLAKALERRRSQADGQVVTDYALNLTLRDTNPERLRELPGIFARGVTSIKMFMAYEAYQLNDATIFRAMEIVAAHRGLAVLHAENFEIISELRRAAPSGGTGPDWHLATSPAVTEGEAVHRVIAFARQTGARLLLYHQSSEDGVREIRAAKARGQAVYGEVCVAYLVYTSADYARTLERGYSIQVSPPIRDARHQAALWEALADGTLDIVSSDHGPHPRQPGEVARGVSSIETRLALVHQFGVRTGRLSPNRWVEVCCANPVAVFGLPRKGQLRPGYDADIVLFDPEKTMTLTPETLHSAIDYCSYDGLSVTGYPVVTISRGEVIVEDGRFVGPPGRGRFITRGGAAS
jgi:dihydropyrimidinase